MTLRILPQDAPRVAALLSGDVQVIENVPTADVGKLRGNKQLTMYKTISDRLIYLHLDSDRDASPFVTDKARRAAGEESAEGSDACARRCRR